jgi:sigma-B regulation protein RsbU (phosphoserine phosphatase)
MPRRAREAAWAAGPGRGWLLAAVGAGLLVFAAGLALALAFLPEWRTGPLPGPAFFRARFQEIAGRAGLLPDREQPKVELITHTTLLEEAYAGLGEQAAPWLMASRAGVCVNVSAPLHEPDKAGQPSFAVNFSLDGRPLEVTWSALGGPLFGRVDEKKFELLADTLEGLLPAAGETLGKRQQGHVLVGPQLWRRLDLAGSSPPQQVAVLISPPSAVIAARLPASAGGPGSLASVEKALASVVLLLPLALAAAVIFLALLLKSRIDLVNGTVIALLALASVSPTWLAPLWQPLEYAVVGVLFGAVGKALWLFFVWSAGESLLRATDPDFSTSLDSLRRGRLGPRGGRGLLLGFALGSGLAGVRLALYALAVVLPGISPAGSSLDLPIFQPGGSPLMAGLSVAAGTALLTALAVRFLPGRWVLPAAAVAGGYVLSPLQLMPFPAEWALNALYAGALVWICWRRGLTTLLAAAAVSCLLPAAVYAGLHRDWLRGSFALTSLLAAAFLVFGLVGIARPEERGEGDAEPPPPFMRRLAQERRIRDEVDLLARMQLGLLPQEMPRLAGYQIAARSVLASEAGGDLYDFLPDAAGRLWIAAGDVAGHGYSCAVAQAMVKAGLLSLVEPEESPAGVLRGLDRVLRSVSMDHSFTSLALIRLDPASGTSLLANAGNPYPLVLVRGDVSEVELPGLPLGRGPVQAYADREFQLPAGGVLVLCSDGLFEALDRHGNAYGFERAREVLRAMGHRPAAEIVDALLNDLRRHLGEERAPDDVTVVVVKRG